MGGVEPEAVEESLSRLSPPLPPIPCIVWTCFARTSLLTNDLSQCEQLYGVVPTSTGSKEPSQPGGPMDRGGEKGGLTSTYVTFRVVWHVGQSRTSCHILIEISTSGWSRSISEHQDKVDTPQPRRQQHG